MNMIKTVNAFVALLLLCIACNSKKEKETPNGFKFTVEKDTDSPLPKKDEIVVFDFIMKDSKDSVWNDTHEAGLPGVVMVADSAALSSEDGMTQMFRMLSKGDSVTVKMPVTEFFKEVVRSPVPPSIDSTLTVSYFINVRDILKMDEFRTFQTKIMEEKKTKQKAKDAVMIDEYLSDNNITAKQDTSGVRFVIHSENGKAKPTVNNCVEVSYKGRFLKDGQVFDSSENLSFPLTGVIPGWKIGIPLLGIGDSATFYIPSALAYGPQGYPGAIPPDAVLIFDVRLLGIGATFDQKTRTCK